MLQKIGTRTSVTDAEIAGNTTNEAIQFNLIYAELRDTLLRKAPWNCAMRTANLTYITSQTGTPENTSAATNLWAPGQPAPPWAYEYQYPVDCLQPRWVIPSTQTGFAGGVPITTAVTGGASSYWWGQPVRFKVQNDQFYSVSAAAINAGGTGYAVGDLIVVALEPTVNGLTNKLTTFLAGAPQGAAVVLQVLTAPAGVIGTVAVVGQVTGDATPIGGSYFYDYSGTVGNNAVPQGSTTGAGTGATFNLTFTTAPASQRVILTNQEFATLAYTQQVTDPNLFDPTFREALYMIGGAQLQMALKGNRDFSNQLVKMANDAIMSARQDDGNEGLTINDVTPDWIRIRGIAYADGTMYSGPYQGYDWGSYFPMF
jgi:hypothetical protein